MGTSVVPEIYLVCDDEAVKSSCFCKPERKTPLPGFVYTCQSHGGVFLLPPADIKMAAVARLKYILFYICVQYPVKYIFFDLEII